MEFVSETNTPRETNYSGVGITAIITLVCFSIFVKRIRLSLLFLTEMARSSMIVVDEMKYETNSSTIRQFVSQKFPTTISGKNGSGASR
jgi:hypothetical protein